MNLKREEIRDFKCIPDNYLQHLASKLASCNRRTKEISHTCDVQMMEFSSSNINESFHIEEES